MEDKKQDYQRLICSICENNSTCKKDKINIYVIQDKLSMKCINYKYDKKIL